MARDGYGDKTAERQLADQLLAEADYPNGFVTTVSIRPGSPTTLEAAAYVYQQLALNEISATIEPLDSNSYLAKLFDKTYKMAIDTVSVTVDDVDPMFFTEYLCASPQNFTGLCDAQIEAVFSQQQQLTDHAARLTKVHELTNKTMD